MGSDVSSRPLAFQRDSEISGIVKTLAGDYRLGLGQVPAVGSWGSCLAVGASHELGAAGAEKVRRAGPWGAAVVDAAGVAVQAGFGANVPGWEIGKGHSVGHAVAAAADLAAGVVAVGSELVEDR